MRPDLRSAAEAALAEGRPFRITSPDTRQPLPGYRLELLCVGLEGAVLARVDLPRTALHRDGDRVSFTLPQWETIDELGLGDKP